MRTTQASPLLFRVAGACLLLLGCQHSAVGRGVDIASPVPSITPEELFEMGLLQVRQGDLLRAEQYLSAARNDGYDQSRVAYWLVRVCVAAGRYHSALNHAARYLRNDPTNWRLRLVVASIHEALGDLEHTRRDLEFIVRAEPSWPLPHYRLALLYSLDPSGNRRAIQHYEAYLDLDPKGVHAAEVDTLLARARELAAESNAEPPFGVRAESEQLP